MSLKLVLAGSLLAVAGIPAFAQSTVPDSTAPNPPKPLPYDRGYDKPSTRADTINAVEAPQTQALNSGQSDAVTAQQQHMAVDEGQYAIDRKSYMDALVEHDRAVDRTDQRYARQQMAYADAMAAWRAQVAACKAGHQRACDMPSPTPDQFY